MNIVNHLVLEGATSARGLHALTLTCRNFYNTLFPNLYHNVYLSKSDQILAFSRTLRQDPDLSKFIRKFCLVLSDSTVYQIAEFQWELLNSVQFQVKVDLQEKICDSLDLGGSFPVFAKRIQTLELEWVGAEIQEDVIIQLLGNSQNLQTLHLSNTPKEDDVTDFLDPENLVPYLSDSLLGRIIPNMPNLKELRIDSFDIPTSLFSLLARLPDLETLIVNNTSPIYPLNESLLIKAFSDIKALKTLDLFGCLSFPLTPDLLSVLAANLAQSLEHITLPLWNYPSNSPLIDVAAPLSKLRLLRSLYIPDCSIENPNLLITAVTLATKCPFLKDFGIVIMVDEGTMKDGEDIEAGERIERMIREARPDLKTIDVSIVITC